MAELTKKYLGEVAVEALVTNIKAEDQKILAAAKAHAEGLAPNYDASGSAATAEANAKAHAEEKVAELANGQVKLNKEAIEKLNGTDTTEGSVAKAVKDAKDALQGNIDAVDGKADANAQAIAAINNETTGILAQAKADATEKANAVQGTVDALAEKVGEVPTDKTVMGIIGEIQSGNASDNEAIQAQIDALSKNKADKTQVATDIADAVKAEEDARKAAVEAVQGAVDTLAGTHATDKKALEDAIALKADQTALDAVSGVANAAATKVALEEEVNRAKGEEARIEGLVIAEAERAAAAEGALDERLEKVEAFFEGAAEDSEGLNDALDTLAEIQAYIGTDGAAADQMVKDIAANKKAIEDHVATDHDFGAADEALKAELEGKINAKADKTTVEGIDGRLEVVEGKVETLEGEMDSAEGRLDAVEGAVATKAEAKDLTDAVAALEGVDAGQETRIAALEGKFGDGEGSVEDMIADAVADGVAQAEANASTDATTKANKALEDAKKYADEEDAKIESRVDALEAASAKHALASDLTALAGRVETAEGEIDTLQTEMDTVEAAVATKAAQADLEALAGRVTTAEGKVSTLEGKMTAVETKASDNADAIAALTKTHNEDKQTLQDAINANTSAINSWVALSKEEIDAMFA